MAIQTGTIGLEVFDTSTDLCRQDLKQGIGQERYARESLDDRRDEPTGEHCFARTCHEVVGVFARDVGVSMVQQMRW